MFFRKQHLHFTGIGGIGMSGIAEVLHNLGYTITGSDQKLSPTTHRLASLGVRIREGHDAAHVAGAKALVVTSAVHPGNPELVEAKRLGIPIIPRGELLAELMRIKYGIAIAGSHGKTSTTSMTAAILAHAGLDPTVVVGGKVGTLGGSNARLGKSDFLVVESDESDGSFLKLAPILAVITNIDREHLDHYSSLEEIQAAFQEFVNKVPFYGAAIVCIDDENVQQILPGINRRTITYGVSPQADLVIAGMECGNFHSTWRLRVRGSEIGEFQLRVPGVHNVLNATAAIAVARELEVSDDATRLGLLQYTGVDRRFQVRGVAGDITVVDDYGHHPTEIRATLAAARLCNYKRVHVIFQPHRYTRTQHLLDDFGRSFNQADSVFLLDIYAASEPPIEGISSELLTTRLQEFGHKGATYAGSGERGVAMALDAAASGDAIITLGAGNVSLLAEHLLDALTARESTTPLTRGEA